MERLNESKKLKVEKSCLEKEHVSTAEFSEMDESILVICKDVQAEEHIRRIRGMKKLGKGRRQLKKGKDTYTSIFKKK